jgi:hypothetical protein
MSLRTKFLQCRLLVLFFAIMARPAAAQLSTLEHLAQPGFWPTRINHSSDDFAGLATCSRCHTEIAASQKLTSMARSAAHPADNDALRTHPHLTFEQGRFHYEITTSPAGSTYTASDGEHSLSAPLTWAFGAGTVGQSFLYEKDHRWYEARVSFFGSIEGLHFTPGRELLVPHTLEEAMSRPVGNQETMRCFKCHATGLTSEYSVESAKKVFLGVSCEACHGPGRKHADANSAELALSGTVSLGENSLIFNPQRLSPADSVDFCGACHSTSWDVRMSSSEGHATILSPVYRLQNSKCWGKGDARLTCVACHDPHRPLDRRAESYDGKCLACHASASAANANHSSDHLERACPIAKDKCTSCHMPKTNVAELHYAVTDHDIRRPGAPNHPVSTTTQPSKTEQSSQR